MVRHENGVAKPEGNPNEIAFQAIFPRLNRPDETVKFLADNPIMSLGAGHVDTGSACRIEWGIDQIQLKPDKNPSREILTTGHRFCEQSHKMVAEKTFDS